MTPVDIAFFIVISLWGVAAMVGGLKVLFEHWRDWQDVREWLHSDDPETDAEVGG